jgi:hypothetical protein
MRIFLAAILLAVSFSSNSFSMPIDSTYGSYWEIDTAVTNIRITGATSGTVIPKRQIQKGYDYVITFQDSIGAAGDSAYMTCIVYGTDGSTVMASDNIGSNLYANARYGRFRLPIGVTAFGSYFKVTVTRTNATTKTNIVRAELIKRTPMTTNIDFRTKR